MNKANEMAIRIVHDYYIRLERKRRPYWRSPEFAQLVYSQMAAKDILDILTNNISEPPLPLIEEYRDKMNEYSCLNPKHSIMYSIAYDTAESIIDELIGTYW